MPKKQKTKKAKSAKGSSNIFTRAASKFSSMHKSAQILILALTVGIVGGGGFAVYNSYAAVPYLNSSQCYLLGRVYAGGSGNPCASKCISGAGSMVVASPYNYCSGAVSKISSAKCNELKRVWINNGCARRWQQGPTGTTTPNAIQCKYAGHVYWVGSTYDSCQQNYK